MDIDVGLHCTVEAHSPPPSRLLTEEAEEDEEEGRVFILSLRICKMEVWQERDLQIMLIMLIMAS